MALDIQCAKERWNCHLFHTAMSAVMKQYLSLDGDICNLPDGFRRRLKVLYTCFFQLQNFSPSINLLMCYPRLWVPASGQAKLRNSSSREQDQIAWGKWTQTLFPSNTSHLTLGNKWIPTPRSYNPQTKATLRDHSRVPCIGTMTAATTGSHQKRRWCLNIALSLQVKFQPQEQ